MVVPWFEAASALPRSTLCFGGNRYRSLHRRDAEKYPVSKARWWNLTEERRERLQGRLSKRPVQFDKSTATVGVVDHH